MAHGPLVDFVYLSCKVRGYVAQGEESGNLALGGEFEPGIFIIKLTMLTETEEDAKIMKDEVFDSVVNINVFDT